MGVGDKLVCKFEGILKTESYEYVFIKNKIYNISSVFNDGTYGVNGLVFNSLDTNGSLLSKYELYDYFYTNEEIRKLKLKTIL